MTQDNREHRGWFRRFVDWLMWDGEDEVREAAQDVAPTFRPTVCPPPPRHDVDSIDWEAFAEGRPQEADEDLAAPAAVDAGVPDSETFDEGSLDLGTASSVGETSRLCVRPATTAEVMASIQWDR